MDVLARLKGGGGSRISSEIGAKSRALAFGEVEAMLLGWLRARPSRFAPVCGRTPEESVSIVDWADLHADIVEAGRRRPPHV